MLFFYQEMEGLQSVLVISLNCFLVCVFFLIEASNVPSSLGLIVLIFLFYLDDNLWERTMVNQCM